MRLLGGIDAKGKSCAVAVGLFSRLAAEGQITYPEITCELASDSPLRLIDESQPVPKCILVWLYCSFLEVAISVFFASNFYAFNDAQQAFFHQPFFLLFSGWHLP